MMYAIKDWLLCYRGLIPPFILFELAFLAVAPLLLFSYIRSTGGKLFKTLLWGLATIGFVLALFHMGTWEDEFVRLCWSSGIPSGGTIEVKPAGEPIRKAIFISEEDPPSLVRKVLIFTRVVYVIASFAVFVCAATLPSAYLRYKERTRVLEFENANLILKDARK